jgi:hypothetical protein
MARSQFAAIASFNLLKKADKNFRGGMAENGEGKAFWALTRP